MALLIPAGDTGKVGRDGVVHTLYAYRRLRDEARRIAGRLARQRLDATPSPEPMDVPRPRGAGALRGNDLGHGKPIAKGESRMSKRVHYDPYAQPNMDDDRCTSVWVDFTNQEGLTIDGTDFASWPSRDYLWQFRVAADQTPALREALGAEDGQDTLDVLVDRFGNKSYGFWLGFSAWLDEHNIEYSQSSRWADN